MSKIKISHEVPLVLLKRSREFNDYDYCLPHLMDQHEEYQDFFLESRDKGRHIMMDNSLHELGVPYHEERLFHWLDELKPQALNLNKLDLNEFFSVDAPNMNASEANTSKIHNPSTQPNYKDHYMEMLNTLTSYMKKYPMDEFPIISLKLKPLIHLNNFLADKDEAWFSHDENRKQLVILLRSICYSDPEMRTYDAQYPLIELDGFLKRDITRFGIEKTQLDDLEPHELDLSHLDFDEFFSAHAPNMKGTFRK